MNSDFPIGHQFHCDMDCGAVASWSANDTLYCHACKAERNLPSPTEIVSRVVSVSQAAADYRQIIEDTQFDPGMRKLMFQVVTFEAAKRLTGYRHATKVHAAVVNDANTIGAVCIAVDGWYVRCTICLVTQTLMSVDDERKPSMRGAA